VQQRVWTKLRLLDHVFGTGKERWRHFETERLCSLQIDEQLNFRGLLDR
jgi:hypothetical protein